MVGSWEPLTARDREAHLPKALESNFSSVVMGFFGQHPFELSPEAKGRFYEDCHKHIAKETVEVGFGDHALEQYWRACKEGKESRAGEYPWLCAFERAYLGLPFIVSRQMEEIVEKQIP